MSAKRRRYTPLFLHSLNNLSADEETRNKMLVEDFSELIYWHIKCEAGPLCRTTECFEQMKEKLFPYGVEGLLEATQHFDDEHDTRFEQVANPYIRRSVLKGLTLILTS